MRITSFGLFLLVLGTFAVPPAEAENFLLPSPTVTVVGESHRIAADRRESLLDVARRNGLGFFDMKQANPDVDMWVPRDGAEVLLPTSFVLPNARRRGVVVNIAEVPPVLLFRTGRSGHGCDLPDQHRPHGLADPAGQLESHAQAHPAHLASAQVHHRGVRG